MINSFRLEADCKCFLDIRILLSAFLYVFLICVRARILKTKKKITKFWWTNIFPLQGYCLNHEHGLGSSRNVISSNVTSLVVKSCCIESECTCKNVLDYKLQKKIGST